MYGAWIYQLRRLRAIYRRLGSPSFSVRKTLDGVSVEVEEDEVAFTAIIRARRSAVLISKSEKKGRR